MKTEKKIVKRFTEILPDKMTKSGALRYGDRTMSPASKKAGFKTVIFEARLEINGWEGYRINYVKTV